MTTVEMAGHVEVTPAVSERGTFSRFREWVTGMVTRYDTPFYGYGGPKETPTFREHHIPTEVKNFVVDWPFGD